MKEKNKAKEILNNAYNVWGYQQAKQKALESCQQIRMLAPIQQNEYWDNVRNELSKLKVE